MANILIVEDDTDLREGLSFSFSSEGHHVEETESKKDSLRKILSTCLDIEERSKSGRIDPQIGVELLIVSLCN